MSAQRRAIIGIPLVVVCASGALGCLDKEAQDPGTIVREETVNRVGPPSRATSRTVRCGCDADANLHISAPQGSQVSRPEDATHDAEAQVVLPDDAPVPLRRTKSLGFIGDAPLTQRPSRGGPWNVPDALLPAHRHIEPSYGVGYGYRSYGRGWVPSAGYAPAPPAYGGGMTSIPPGWR
jgi:hypothetical protein